MNKHSFTVSAGKASGNFGDFSASKLQLINVVKTKKFKGALYDTVDGPRYISDENLMYAHLNKAGSKLLVNADNEPAKEGEVAFVSDSELVDRVENIIGIQ